MNEDEVWLTADPSDLWVLDKLILSLNLGYSCGPIGVDVPSAGYYIVRPAVNALGLGLGAEKVWIEESTDDLPLGFFWCEWFEGRHLSVDFKDGKCLFVVEGTKESNTFTKWTKWEKVDVDCELPEILIPLVEKYQTINVEMIGDKIIEVHLRGNPDFVYGNKDFIPVWEGQKIDVPKGYKYIECEELHGRVGALIS